jgi:hypothetical protein
MVDGITSPMAVKPKNNSTIVMARLAARQN